MNSVPVVDILPWGDTAPQGGRTILICDSVETDGRFLLYTLASQCLSPPNRNAGSTVAASSSASVRRSAAERRRAVTNSNSNTSLSLSGDGSAESNSGHVLWLGCGANTQEQICTAMKKIGCDVAPLSNSQTKVSMVGKSDSAITADIHESINSPSKFQTINILTEMEQTILKDASDGTPDYNSFLKSIYKRIREWKKSCMGHLNQANPKPCLVLLDNVSQLANFFGSRLVYSFILQVRSLLQQGIILKDASTRHTYNPFSLIISCSHDLDQEYYLAATNQEQSNQSVTGAKQAQYIGAGGRGVLLNSPAELALLEQRASYELLGSDGRGGGEGTDVPVWERALVELADGIVDVTPLPSGFARDVMGRLVFTERKGGLGWKGGKDGASKIARSNGIHGTSGSGSIGNIKFSSQIVNYSCWEGGVKAIRLRA